ncbi:hypothetical protein Q5741_02895 [Paenibacillus sp. JX-17]|uniref:Uncharacterized protein n=1 Tax=Paenibacillus lacisoli TaxID=3064525 RepID=A0ABT9C7X3_9BACL|nr:hypothetical protein [Paenibacillus sp. JX-17]MDO7905358.1 hypothetical protein [Paenibacillus sp. JX-17]
MKNKLMSLSVLVFFVPAIILSVVMWRDYTNEIGRSVTYTKQVKGIYYLDNGKKVLAVAESSSGLEGLLYDVGSRQIRKEIPLDSDMFRQYRASYQQDKLVIATKSSSNDLRVYVIDSAGNSKELALSTIPMPSYLESDAHLWRGRLVFAGGSKVFEYDLIAEVEGTKLQTVRLNTLKKLTSRPVYMDEVMNSYQPDEVPMFKLDLKNGKHAYIGGILGSKGQLAVYEEAGDDPFDSDKKALKAIAKGVGIDPTRLMRVDSNYPKQAYFYNAITGNTAGKVPLPADLYQAELYAVNEQEILIVGTTSKDAVDGTEAAYLYNERTKKSVDATPLAKQLAKEERVSGEIEVYKQIDDSRIYYVNPSRSGGWLDLANGEMQVLTKPEVESWQHEPQSDKPSLEGFMDYIKTWNAIVINWLVWLLIPIAMILFVTLVPRVIRSRVQRQLRNGIILHGKLVNIRETGMLVNNQPMVLFTVQFNYEGMQRKVDIRKVVSYLESPRVGDPVVISYNPRKNKAIFVTETDLQPDLNDQQVIQGAILRHIIREGSYGRAQGLLLQFEADQQTFEIPVIQPQGFDYRLGERADLIQIGGGVRLLRYGNAPEWSADEQVQLEGEVVAVSKCPLHSQGKTVMLMELSVEAEGRRLQKTSSPYVPPEVAVEVGTRIPISMPRKELQKELRLLKGKQGSAVVETVYYRGTVGERPYAEIIAERNGQRYRIEQSIEPLYGIQPGDELWMAYDEASMEATMIRYASNS